MTPRSAKRPVASTKSTSTPFNDVKAMKSRQKLFFPPLSSIQHDPSKATPTNGPPTVTPTDDLPSEGPLKAAPTDDLVNEVVDDDMKEVDRGQVPVEDIGEDEDIGAEDIGGDEAMDNIIDELKNLQNNNSNLHKQLEVIIVIHVKTLTHT